MTNRINDSKHLLVFRVPANEAGFKFVEDFKGFLNKANYKLIIRYTGKRPKGTNQGSTLKENATSIRGYIESKKIGRYRDGQTPHPEVISGWSSRYEGDHNLYVETDKDGNFSSLTTTPTGTAYYTLEDGAVVRGTRRTVDNYTDTVVEELENLSKENKRLKGKLKITSGFLEYILHLLHEEEE